jgi:hypothetical protein
MKYLVCGGLCTCNVAFIGNPDSKLMFFTPLGLFSCYVFKVVAPTPSFSFLFMELLYMLVKPVETVPQGSGSVYSFIICKKMFSDFLVSIELCLNSPTVSYVISNLP